MRGSDEQLALVLADILTQEIEANFYVGQLGLLR